MVNGSIFVNNIFSLLTLKAKHRTKDAHMFNSTKTLKSLLILTSVISLNTFADTDTEQSCKDINGLINKGDLKGALEEARWCVDGLEQMQQQAEKELFSKSIDGWVRGEISSNKALGITVSETLYKKGNNSIQVSLTSGGGGLVSAFAQMGMMQAGSRVRLGHHKGTLIPDEGLIVNLGEGRILNIGGVPASNDMLKSFAKKLPLDELAGK